MQQSQDYLIAYIRVGVGLRYFSRAFFRATLESKRSKGPALLFSCEQMNAERTASGIGAYRIMSTVSSGAESF